MDCQDWTPVILRRRHSKKDPTQIGSGSSIQFRDPNRNEKIKMARLENSDEPGPKKRVSSESIQELIRKRIELKLTQDKADMLCSFPRHTFKEIESNRLIPSEEQKRRIQHNFQIHLKIDTITSA